MKQWLSLLHACRLFYNCVDTLAVAMGHLPEGSQCCFWARADEGPYAGIPLPAHEGPQQEPAPAVQEGLPVEGPQVVEEVVAVAVGVASDFF
jgi:hypothetical protein